MSLLAAQYPKDYPQYPSFVLMHLSPTWDVTLYMNGIGAPITEWITCGNSFTEDRSGLLMSSVCQHFQTEVSHGNCIGEFTLEEMWSNPAHESDKNELMFKYLPK